MRCTASCPGAAPTRASDAVSMRHVAQPAPARFVLSASNDSEYMATHNVHRRRLGRACWKARSWLRPALRPRGRALRVPQHARCAAALGYWAAVTLSPILVRCLTALIRNRCPGLAWAERTLHVALS